MRMLNPKQYYENTKNMGPSPLIKKFFFLLNKYNENLPGRTAIDLGCGAGNDTAFLLEKGFKVIVIDQEEQVREIIKNRNLNKENLELIIGDFSKIEIPMTDLLFANFSLFFVKNYFNDFIERILKSINEKGFFVGNFLGKDDYRKVNGVTTIEKDELMDFFTDFKIFYFSEEKYYFDTVLEENKFCYVYTVIAQKNK